ncbi:MFS transporter [Maricaulis alexandrii]|uniref:MFS transporter n=1 Tax=Maricaulis alexandrii TaxID=2570354 RepID=UPI001108C50A|nr:MFS transporter [Maricaulis alexandrii]
MSQNPKELIEQSPMVTAQIIAVSMCVFLNALDGFDVLSISFASPGIAADWGIDRAALGVVLAMELVGMAIGSIIIGNLADRIGRRPVILGCLVIMAAGMFAAAFAHDMNTLLAFRFGTGLGIGGMLAATNAMVAEFSNLKNRSLCVTIMAAGYPMGAIVGGSIASLLLTEFHWRAIFIFGGAVTALSIPLVLALLPESVYFLEARRPKKALDKINAVLKRLGREAVSVLPDLTADNAPKAGLSTLFGPRLISITLILTLAYFFHIMTFYFILKWIPKIVVDMGFAAPLAGGVLVWANVGGAMGAVLLGILSQRFGVKGLVIGAMVLGAIMVAVFGRGQEDLQQLSLIAAVAGFCTNAGVVGLYALFAQGFPTEVRAGGTGFAIGVGRGGAALGPIIAGLLFEAGAGLQVVAIIMGSGSLMAAIALLFLRLNRAPDAVPSEADKNAA